MNIINIIDQIEKVDPDFNDRISPRRAAIRNMMGFGSKVAIAAVPLALGGLFKKAYGQTAPTDVIGILNFALTLEYLEFEFYKAGVASSAITMASGTTGTAALTTIRDDEGKHVAFLRSAISGAGGTPVTLTAANFDFTAKGNLGTATFTDYDTFLAVAQAFEDTGVRAYKGQAPNLVGNRPVLGAALGIHSVEARHASHIRQMRKARGGAAANVKPWITNNDRGGLPAFTQDIYNGEDLETQAGVAITGIAGSGVTISKAAATESFDEPLSYSQVIAIVTPFLAS